MDCNGDDADISESSSQRRSSARILKLQREKAVRASSKKKVEPVKKKKLKNVKASKRQKVEKPLVLCSVGNGVTKVEKEAKVVEKVEKPLIVGSEVVENGVMKLETEAGVVEKVEKTLGSDVVENGVMMLEAEAEVVAKQGENTMNVDKMAGLVENGMTVRDKSAYSRVTETLRTFNKYFLQFIQGEEKGYEKTEAVKEKSPKQKRGDALGSNTKQVVRRPDLKALAKMKETNAVLQPNNIGSIPGIDVGHQFFSRAEMVAVGFNSHWLNGIDCINHAGCEVQGYSGYKLPIAIAIFMSGQYEDDLDNCDDVIYTGQGGNKLSGNRHQFRDQVLRLGNLGLKNSMEQCVPVRVVRAHESKSSYVGKVYTYDGLYKGMCDTMTHVHVEGSDDFSDGYNIEYENKVVSYWTEKGVSGYTVYKFRLKRLEGQPSLTTNQVQFVRGQIPKSISELRGLVCEDISDGQENIPIPATNLVDDPPFAPSGFTYCNSVQVSERVKLPAKAAGCNCSGNCAYSKTCSCAGLNGSDFPYVHRDGGRLIEPKAVVFECGVNCGCGPGCVNRISQRGLKYRLEVFRTPKKGWAVRSWDYIPSGAPVCEYIGKLMKTDDVEAIPENNYIFDIDCLQTMKGLDGREKRLGDVCIPSSETDDGKDSVPEFCLDAGLTGNVARFINHSCQPNLFVQCVLSTHHEIKQARVVLFAADNIPPLKELSYDYGYALNSVEGPDGKIKQLHCFCGAAICRKRLF